MKNYTTLTTKPTTSEIVINKSRFIGYAVSVVSPSDAAAKIKEISKKYYDATHNCYAYITDEGTKYSDDGEPQSTAGIPILDCIKKQKLNNCLVIVTRYFGGVKLGAGGLVRAYSSCASQTLANSPKVEMKSGILVEFSSPYDLYQTIITKISSRCKITETLFGDSVIVKLIVNQDEFTALEETVSELSKGKIRITKGEATFYSV